MAARSSFVPIQIGLTGLLAEQPQENLFYYFFQIGSIGMGKSTVANHFRAAGCSVFDADACVHQLYSQNGAAVEPIRRLFPSVIVNNAVDRQLLGQIVLNDSEGGISPLQQLTDIVHPLVTAERLRFVEHATTMHQLIVVHDIPLLLEQKEKHNSYIDEIVVCSASPDIQRARVLRRPHMTTSKLESILRKQMPDAEKRLHANFIINTDAASLAPARAQVANVIEAVIHKHPDKWEAFKQLKSESDGSNTHVFRSASLPNQNPGIAGTPDDELRQRVDCVLFDLDDTLLPSAAPVHIANAKLVEFLEAYGMAATAAAMADGTVRKTGSK